jgi:uncharacterized protein YjbI with pentapeptide repeats
MNEEENRKPKAPEWLYSNIAEASKIARRILFVYLGFVIYSLYTVVGSSDVSLFLGESIPLPILGIEVNSITLLSSFPVVAIAVFAYIQIYVLRIRSMVCDLRERYDYEPNKRLYPWMVLIAEEPDRGAVGWLQRIASTLMIWAPLPVALFLMALWGIRRHDPSLTLWLGLLYMFGVEMVLWFCWRHRCFGCRTERPERLKAVLMIGAAQLMVGMLAALVPFVHSGEILGLNLANAVLAAEPDITVGVTTGASDDALWADFAGVGLAGANLSGAVLAHADLWDADLRCACLDGADFHGAALHSADFRRSTGRDPSFAHAAMWSADFRGAEITRADFGHAAIVGGHFDSASLDSCIFEDADLRTCRLVQASLKNAVFECAKLAGADLSGANLSHAQLDGADLRGAEFTGAVLRAASFVHADLRDATGLTAAQLCSTDSLYKALLPQTFSDKVETICPYVLEARRLHHADREIQTPSCVLPG